MKIRTMAAAAAALSLVAAPAVAEIGADRAAAPVEDESELGGGVILGVAAVVAIIGGIIIAADTEDDTPISS